MEGTPAVTEFFPLVHGHIRVRERSKTGSGDCRPLPSDILSAGGARSPTWAAAAAAEPTAPGGGGDRRSSEERDTLPTDSTGSLELIPLSGDPKTLSGEVDIRSVAAIPVSLVEISPAVEDCPPRHTELGDQLRLHCVDIGHPLVGESEYLTDRRLNFEWRPIQWAGPPLLHSVCLQLDLRQFLCHDPRAAGALPVGEQMTAAAAATGAAITNDAEPSSPVNLSVRDRQAPAEVPPPRHYAGWTASETNPFADVFRRIRVEGPDEEDTVLGENDAGTAVGGASDSRGSHATSNRRQQTGEGDRGGGGGPRPAGAASTFASKLLLRWRWNQNQRYLP